MAKPTVDEIKDNIQAEDADVWNQASQRPDALDLFEGDLAAAIAGAWSDVEDAFVIASVPVTASASPPGGPLSGGIAPLSPGMLTNPASFTVIAEKFSSSFPNGATEGLLALVDAVANGVGQNFPIWVAGYSGTLTASGGSCAWVPPAPPANPAGTPGPWSGGSIEAFALSNGSSAGDAQMTAASIEAAVGNAADASKLKQNQNTLQPALAALIQAIAKGFETTWNDWKTKTKISGGTGTGTAIPPSGAVVGAVASPTIG